MSTAVLSKEPLIQELIIEGIDQFPLSKTKSNNKQEAKSDADVAVNEFLNLTRAQYGFGPAADLFKSYLTVVAQQ